MSNEELGLFVGKQIEKIRKQRGLTQTDLAYKLGVSRQAVSRYEKGERKANQDILFELSKILNVSVNAFFPEKETTYEPKTIAAHLDGNFTNEELQQILEIAEIVRKKRK